MIGYGTWGLGGRDYGPITLKKSLKLLNYAYKNNILMLDTAPLYGNGRSEKIIGSFLKKKDRKKIILSTKCGMLPHKGFDWKQDFSVNRLIEDLRGSLIRLGTGYVDYFLLHSPNLKTINLNKIVLLSKILKKQGLIKKFGISLRSPLDFKKFKLEDKIDVVEFNFNILDQRALDIKLFKFLRQKNIISICRTPLCFGFLSDKKILKKNLSKDDHRKYYPNTQFKVWTRLKEHFIKYKNEYNHSSYSDFALHYCLSQGFDYVIPGMMEVSEIKENIEINKIKKISDKNLALIYSDYKKIESNAFVTKKQKILKKIKYKKI
jgi:aryl-alcohol dehydrogenase-like predicted oxidoreductase